MYVNNSPAKSAFSVSELNRQAKSLLESSFLQVRVQGEISNLSKPASGHWYFTLKDDKAQIRCALFRNRNLRVRFQPKEGDQVILTGKVSLYEGRGDFQLIGDILEADGEGQLQRQFEALKNQLQAEGVFDPAHKQPLPEHPKKLAIITSPTGAALHDVLAVLKRRFPSLEITLYPSAVQGNGAEDELIHALQQVQRHNWADVVIIGRGGGSLEDLWSFNGERLARALFACQIPIISAVGHEVDFSIADFVANVRAPTPSAAAEMISPDQDALRIRLDQLYSQLIFSLENKLEAYKYRVSNLSARIKHPGEQVRAQQLQLSALKDRLQSAVQTRLVSLQHRQTFLAGRLNQASPEQQIPWLNNRLEQLLNRLQQATDNRIASYKHPLAQQAARLNAVSPLATLDRGYAITQTAAGELIRSTDQVEVGDKITTRLHNGTLTCTVEDK